MSSASMPRARAQQLNDIPRRAIARTSRDARKNAREPQTVDERDAAGVSISRCRKSRDAGMPNLEWTMTISWRRPRLGIDAEDISGQLGSYFGAPDGEGILVRDVNPGSAAEECWREGGRRDYVASTANGSMASRNCALNCPQRVKERPQSSEFCGTRTR